MARWKFILERRLLETTTVEVEAPTREAARVKARRCNGFGIPSFCKVVAGPEIDEGHEYMPIVYSVEEVQPAP